MPDRVRAIRAQALPRGLSHFVGQFALLVGFYVVYVLIGHFVDGNDIALASWNATKVIDFERALHVFIEPSLQAWTLNKHWLMDAATWIYINAHPIVTVGALAYIYLRHNRAYAKVRNTFVIAMGIALLGYAIYPTAPPRLMPEWGFTDTIRQITGLTIEKGRASSFFDLYAAIPSLHVCFATMIGWPMARLSTRRWVRISWSLYPVLIAFVVIVTANHYLTDVLLGVLTAAVAALIASRLPVLFGRERQALGHAPA